MRMAIARSVFLPTFVAAAAASVAVLVAQAPSGTSEPLDATQTDPVAAFKAAVEKARLEVAALENYTPDRTPWGDPDLRGVYLGATYTPLQRPVELGEKASYTDEEAVEIFRKKILRDADPNNEYTSQEIHYDWKEYGMDGWQTGARPSLRTSLIVDPPNGRLPPLTPEAEQRRDARIAARKLRNPAVSVSTLDSLYTRCILGSSALPLVRGGYAGVGSEAGVTSEALIFQSPGYVTIVIQSNNDVRIVPLDGRPHLSERIRQWYGDSRGRWEGNTLVVETTNFRDRSPARHFPGSEPGGNEGATDAQQVVERFTRIGPSTLRYEYTVTDPTTWTRSWRVDTEMPRVDPPLIYEFACHESNYGVINVVQGARQSLKGEAKDAVQGTGATR